MNTQITKQLGAEYINQGDGPSLVVVSSCLGIPVPKILSLYIL